MTRTRKKKRKNNPNASFRLFLIFLSVAVLTIVLLEYIDFKKGEKSFVFTKIFPLKRTTVKVSQFNERFINVLNANKIPYDYFQDDEYKYHFKLDIDQNRFNGLITKVKQIIEVLKGSLNLKEIQGLANKSIMLYEVKLDGKISHLLLISKLRPVIQGEKKYPQHPPSEKIEEIPTKRTPAAKKKEARIAFIIDDIGEYDIGPLELKRLKIPITASVLPDSRYAGEVVYWLKEYRLKAMIHLPMQPTNSKKKRYDPQKVITLNSTTEQISKLIQRAKQIVPIAEGMNNHEGSLVTTNRSIMTRVLKVVKKEGLFFVDSRTIGRTVAYDVAQELNIKSAYKDVFLDHIPTYSHSLAQIRKLVDIALHKGEAIAIGHPFKSTLKAIKDSKKYIKAKGVKIVFVKDLLK